MTPPSPSSTGGAMGHIELHGAPAWWCTVGKEQIEPRLKPPAWGRQGKWEGSPFMDPPLLFFAAHPLPRGHFLLLSPVPPPLRALGHASAQPYSEAGMGNGDAGAHTERGTRGVRRDGGPQGTAGSPAPWKHLFLPPPTPMQRCQTRHVYCHSVPCTQAGLSPSAPSGRILGRGGSAAPAPTLATRPLQTGAGGGGSRVGSRCQDPAAWLTEPKRCRGRGGKAARCELRRAAGNIPSWRGASMSHGWAGSLVMDTVGRKMPTFHLKHGLAKPKTWINWAVADL